MNNQSISFDFPVDPIELAKSCGHKVMTYREYSECTNQAIEYITTYYDGQGFAFWSRYHKTFVICYNETLTPETIRHTIIHEIAHIALGHVTPDTERQYHATPRSLNLAVFAHGIMYTVFLAHLKTRYVNAIEREAEIFVSVFKALSMYAEFEQNIKPEPRQTLNNAI